LQTTAHRLGFRRGRTAEATAGNYDSIPAIFLKRRKEQMKKRLAILFLLVIALTSCANLQPPQTLDRIKADLECIPYQKEMGWKEISAKLGDPDLVPLPEPGTDLTKNARGYSGKVVIFYTGIKEVEEESKVRFQEIVTTLEICRKK
jgi:hypothetical protein